MTLGNLEKLCKVDFLGAMRWFFILKNNYKSMVYGTDYYVFYLFC